MQDILHHIDQYMGGLENFTRGYEYFGFNQSEDGSITYREWAPAAASLALIGDFSKLIHDITLLNSRYNNNLQPSGNES